MATARRLIIAALMVGVLVGGWTFAHRNRTGITVDYWLGQWTDVPLWLVLIVSFAAGAAVASVVWGFELAKSGLAGRRYRSAIRALDEEVHQLRNLPLAADEAGEGDVAEAPDDAVAGEPQAGVRP